MPPQVSTFYPISRCNIIGLREYIIKNKDLPWDWSGLSWNQNITIEHVLSNKYLPWDFEGLSWNLKKPKHFDRANSCKQRFTLELEGFGKKNRCYKNK